MGGALGGAIGGTMNGILDGTMNGILDGAAGGSPGPTCGCVTTGGVQHLQLAGPKRSIVPRVCGCPRSQLSARGIQPRYTLLQ